MSKHTTEVNYENKNRQRNLGRTGEQGTDNLQYLYKVLCLDCNKEYKVNGSNIYECKCPKCQGGKEIIV